MFVIHMLCAFLLLAPHTVAQYPVSKALSGTKLRCCVVHEPPIVYIDPKTHSNNGMTGLIVDYLREMQALLDWQCSSIELYTDGNGTSFNAFVQMMHDCTDNGSIRNDSQCQCDVGIGGWFRSAEREQKVDILPAFVFDGISVSFPPSSSSPAGKDFFFITTFDLKTWACIIFLILLFVLAKMMDHRFAQNISPSVREDSSESTDLESGPRQSQELNLDRVGKAVKSTVNRIMLQPGSDADRDGGSCGSWLLNLILGVCGLFFILSYEASMTASLVQEKVRLEYQSIADFQTCRIRPEQVCVPGGSAVETFWNNAIAVDSCHNDTHPIRGSLDDVIEAVANGTCRFGLTLDSTLRSAINGKFCGQVLKSEEMIYTAGLGMILPSDSPFTKPMTLATLKLRNEASNPSLDEFFRKGSICAPQNENGPTFAKFQIFFALAFTACGIFLIASLIGRIGGAKGSRSVKKPRMQFSCFHPENMGFAY